ncbi:hypothetical protein VM95_19845 [Streptomyces rubellomurinus]|uniref:Uncharacterized protein n=2 Tax=Streptomyces rubellomurinus (strain ATCC 31215) TaxID=359131 RepID=A0A0F2TBT6_STRR3|nr:hypothetical protein VM95_19845 [Streptomyces rubellomurinus]
MLGQDPTPAAIVRALTDAGLLRTVLPVVYRAEWDAESLGLYASREAARGRCLLDATVVQPEARMIWLPVDDEGETEYLETDGTDSEYYVTAVPVRLTAGEIG